MPLPGCFIMVMPYDYGYASPRLLWTVKEPMRVGQRGSDQLNRKANARREGGGMRMPVCLSHRYASPRLLWTVKERRWQGNGARTNRIGARTHEREGGGCVFSLRAGYLGSPACGRVVEQPPMPCLQICRASATYELAAQVAPPAHSAGQGSQDAAVKRRSQNVPAGKSTSLMPLRNASKAVR